MRLGKNEKKILTDLKNHKTWSYGSDFGVGTVSSTIKILDSLVRKEFAVCVGGVYFLKVHNNA